MATDHKPRLFDYDREPLGLLPESMKTTIEVNDQRTIATLHAPRRHQRAEPPEPVQIPVPMKWLVEIAYRLLR
ncbi:hypothetical protein [Hydrogenophaga atypica]|uniref:Uncharacterized protein n=1 Tax=Hydrogenophaga atypica TaxID=249409 RepID=A0ABW2QS10_9BURK